MGLSKSRERTKTAQEEHSTTAPVTPPWIAEPVQGFTGNIKNFLNTPAEQFVAPASALQNQAFAGAANLGGWKPAADQAIGMAGTAGAAPATTAGVHTANAQGYTGPQLGNAAQVGPVNIAATSQVRPESLLTNWQSYMNPYLQQVIDPTLASYDQETGKQAAAMKAEGARNVAFGGSRFGIREGEFGADSVMNRGLTEGNLRFGAADRAMGLSGQDADRRQGAGYFNAGAENTRGLSQAQLDMQRLVSNQDAANRFRLAQGGIDEAAARYGADASNTANMFNVGQQNQNAALNASLQEQAYQRALQSAGLVGNMGPLIGANARADLGMTADLGTLQRSIEEAKLNAVPTQLQIGGSLIGGLPYPAFVGQQRDGTMTGTNTTTSNPSVAGLLAGVAGAGLSGWASGGFKF